MIQAYPERPSISPGDKLVLHVSTDQPGFRVSFYRQGTTLARMEASVGEQVLPGIHASPGLTDEDWGWPSYTFSIPDDWASGVYIAMLSTVDSDGTEHHPDYTDVSGDEARALFVVLRGPDRPRQRILYKLAWHTYHAYNGNGYGSLYGEAKWVNGRPKPGYKVTTRRPGGGVGGRLQPGIVPFPFDERGIRNSFGFWEAPFIAWLESNGYTPDYCTDWDVHRTETALQGYPLVLSVGHDEYWSEPMRAALETHTRRGGNIAFFSGDVETYRIHYTDDETAFVSEKNAGDEWEAVDPGYRVCGQMGAGGWFNGTKRDVLGYTIPHPRHWLFEGTEVEAGEDIGSNTEHPLVGYEIMGVEISQAKGFPVPAGATGNPADFAILGFAELGPGWQSVPPITHATMGMYTTSAGGHVFSAGTTDWPIVAARDETVAIITRNIVERLSLPSLRILGPFPAVAGRYRAACGDIAAFSIADLPIDNAQQVRWLVDDAEIIDQNNMGIKVRMPPVPSLVTVSAELVDGDGKPSRFGSRSVIPLNRTESLESDMAALLHDMIVPREPGYPLVSARSSPAIGVGNFYPGTVAYLARHVAQLLNALEELKSLRISTNDTDRKDVSRDESD